MSKKTTPLLFGTDPEAFAVYMKDGKPFTLPPYYFRNYLGVKASNDPRHPVFFDNGVFKFHEDGAAFEMAIKPSHNPRDLFDRIHDCADMAQEKILSKFPEDCLPILQFLPTVGFDVKRWEKEGADFFMSTQFGCDPDYDAFEFEKKAQVIDAGKHPHRYGGGHIHFSGSKLIEKDPLLAVQVCAVTAGCAAVAFSDVPELESERTFLYGRPGKFRIQNYGKKNPFGPAYATGIEYRTTSNRWCSDWNIAEKVFEFARMGIEELLPHKKVADIVKDVSEKAIDAILSANQKNAMEVLEYVQAEI